MPAEIRAAGQSDLDALVRLNQDVQALHARLYPDDFKADPDPVDVRLFFAERLDDPKSVIGLAEQDGRAVGYVWFDIQARPDTPFTFARRRLYICHIAVEPQARRRGIASALLGYVERRAAREGIDEIALDSWTANLDAQHFFGARGFVACHASLRKRLAARPETGGRERGAG
jgi:ribosomal protein S18 acetylase RimI-like enzyme